MLSRMAMLPSGSHQGPLGPSSISDRGFRGWGGLVPPGPVGNKSGKGVTEGANPIRGSHLPVLGKDVLGEVQTCLFEDASTRSEETSRSIRIVYLEDLNRSGRESWSNKQLL